jgi:hypothetical protein
LSFSCRRRTPGSATIGQITVIRETRFATITRDRVQGILVVFPGTLLNHGDEIIRFAAHEKLPVVYGRREYVLAGGLMSFDVDRGYGLAHSVLGERYVLMRLFRRTDLPKLFRGAELTIRTLRFAWHLTTIAWQGAAGRFC